MLSFISIYLPTLVFDLIYSAFNGGRLQPIHVGVLPTWVSIRLHVGQFLYVLYMVVLPRVYSSSTWVDHVH